MDLAGCNIDSGVVAHGGPVAFRAPGVCRYRDGLAGGRLVLSLEKPQISPQGGSHHLLDHFRELCLEAGIGISLRRRTQRRVGIEQPAHLVAHQTHVTPGCRVSETQTRAQVGDLRVQESCEGLCPSHRLSAELIGSDGLNVGDVGELGLPARCIVDRPQLMPADPSCDGGLQSLEENAVENPVAAARGSIDIELPQTREPVVLSRLPASQGGQRVVGQAIVTAVRNTEVRDFFRVAFEIRLHVLVSQMFDRPRRLFRGPNTGGQGQQRD